MNTPQFETLLTLAVERRRQDERARGSRAGSATVGGRNMLPVALAESQVDYGATYTMDGDGNVTQDMGLGYGYGTYGIDFQVG